MNNAPYNNNNYYCYNYYYYIGNDDWIQNINLNVHPYTWVIHAHKYFYSIP